MKSGYQVPMYVSDVSRMRSVLPVMISIIFIFVYRLVSITGDPILKLPLAFW
jgi:hypothetical protein